MRKYRYPSYQTNQLSDLNEKADALIKECQSKDIQFIAAMPNYLQHLSRTLIHKLDIPELSHLWPNLKTIVFSGNPIGPYKEDLEKLIGREVPYFGIYFSSEAPIGFEEPSLSPGRHFYRLNLEDIVFSFLGDDGKIRGIHDIIEGEDYDLLLSMPNGMCHYQNGDRIKLIQKAPYPLVEILGRSGEAMNLFGEKIDERGLETIWHKTQESIAEDISTEHFFVYPDHDDQGMPHYKWVLVTDNSLEDPAIAHTLDHMTRNSSYIYQEMRDKLHGIGPAQIDRIPVRYYNEYFENVGFSKQLKVKRIFSQAKQYQEFLKDFKANS